MPDSGHLGRLRTAAARAPKAFKRMSATLARAGLAHSEENALKRAPRGFEDIDDPEIARATWLKSMVCDRPIAEAAIRRPTLVEAFCAFASDSLPLLAWGWDALTDLR